MKYEYTEIKENDSVIGVFRSDGVFVPASQGNSDYQAYLRWLENPDAEETQGGIN